MAVLILSGAALMAWNQAVSLGTNVAAASAIFLDALMVANIFGTLRSAQMKAVFQMAGRGASSEGRTATSPEYHLGGNETSWERRIQRR